MNFRVLLCAAMACATISGNAKEKKVTPPATVEQARIRIWKLTSPSHPALKIVWADSARRKSTDLGVNEVGDQLGVEAAVPAGPGDLEVLEGNGALLAKLDGSLRPDTEAIALISESADGKSMRAEWLDSGQSTRTPSEFVACTLVRGLKDCRVVLGSAVNVQLTAVGAMMRLTGLPHTFQALTVSGDDTEGKPFKWTSEVDFTKCTGATLVICVDNYGRVRPQLSLQGAALAKD